MLVRNNNVRYIFAKSIPSSPCFHWCRCVAPVSLKTPYKKYISLSLQRQGANCNSPRNISRKYGEDWFFKEIYNPSRTAPSNGACTVVPQRIPEKEISRGEEQGGAINKVQKKEGKMRGCFVRQRTSGWTKAGRKKLISNSRRRCVRQEFDSIYSWSGGTADAADEYTPGNLTMRFAENEMKRSGGSFA